MQGAQIPAERDGVVEQAEAGPGFVGRGTVDESEKDSGDDLEDEKDGGRGAEDIKPACTVGGCGMRGGLGERADKAEAQFDPFIGGENTMFQAGHWLDLVDVEVDAAGSRASAVAEESAGAIWINGLGLHEAWVARVGMSPE